MMVARQQSELSSQSQPHFATISPSRVSLPLSIVCHSYPAPHRTLLHYWQDHQGWQFSLSPKPQNLRKMAKFDRLQKWGELRPKREQNVGKIAGSKSYPRPCNGIESRPITSMMALKNETTGKDQRCCLHQNLVISLKYLFNQFKQ